MDIIDRMIDEPNTTKRLTFFLFVFVPGFWVAVATMIGGIYLVAHAGYYALYFTGWLISLVIG